MTGLQQMCLVAFSGESVYDPETHRRERGLINEDVVEVRGQF